VTRLPGTKISCGKGDSRRLGKANAEKTARRETHFAIPKGAYGRSKPRFSIFALIISLDY
jgi:hypothetical protein